uniref:Uncharacterized protein n=1 Tax=Anguilla anguilla TaxID=7936 RepID=A0A0E9XHR4_ANGAN
MRNTAVLVFCSKTVCLLCLVFQQHVNSVNLPLQNSLEFVD